VTFLAGQKLTAAQLNALVVATIQATSMSTGTDTQITNGTTTSVTYTATLTGGTACGRVFVAPPSGIVLISMMIGMFNSGANFTAASFFVRTGGSVGSGTTFLASDDDRGLILAGTNLDQRSGCWTVTGLTPGSTYNVQQNFRVSAGTGSYQRKHLIVVPTI